MDDILVPKDFKDYEPKLIGSFTIRQTVLIVPGFILLIFLKGLLLDSVFIFAAIVIFSIIWALGWTKPYNMKFEEFVATSFMKMFMSPQKRIYKTDSLHRAVIEKKEKKNRRGLNEKSKRKKNRLENK